MKCRFCDYKCPDFYTTKDGRRHSGFTRLNSHIERQHEDEYAQIQKEADTGRLEIAEHAL